MFQRCVKFKGKGLEKCSIGEKVDTYNSLCGCYRIENKPNWYKQKYIIYKNIFLKIQFLFLIYKYI